MSHDVSAEVIRNFLQEKDGACEIFRDDEEMDAAVEDLMTRLALATHERPIEPVKIPMGPLGDVEISDHVEFAMLAFEMASDPPTDLGILRMTFLQSSGSGPSGQLQETAQINYVGTEETLLSFAKLAANSATRLVEEMRRRK